MSDSIRSVKRALCLIRLMNSKPIWAFGELAMASGLAKASLFRLLETLEEEGCVRSPPEARGLYQLCSSVRDLASGVTSGSLLADFAAPAIIAGTRRLRWPLSLAVLDDCYMRVVFCGMPYSRLASKTTTVSRRYWLFNSALGRAYFPFCHPVERQILIERAVALLAEHGSSWPYTPQKLSTEMREIVRTGFSVRWAGANDPTSAIAVPVGRGDELVGSLVCSTYAKSLTQRRIDELVPEIRAVAEEVLAIWRQCNPNSGAAAAVPLPARRSATVQTRAASFKADARLGPRS